MSKRPHTAMTDPEAVHCMFDIETLGSADDAPIAQIGAVLFNPFGTASHIVGAVEGGGIISAPGTEFNQHVEIVGDVDPATLLWWFAQGQQAQQRVFARELERRTLTEALLRLDLWSTSWDRPVDFWWSDMDFDLRLLRAAWKRCAELHGHAPFGSDDGPHRGVRDCRTLRAVGRDLGVEEPLFVGVEHDALDDAHHQALHVTNILRRLHGCEVSP